MVRTTGLQQISSHRLIFPKKSYLNFSNPGSLIAREPGQVLRCCWIGRIVDFKVNILLHLIERLDAAVLKVGPIEMTVVGNGVAAEYLKKSVTKFHNVKLRFIDNVEPNQLDTFLDSEVDVLFAMGASALEGASKGIPTFVLDFSYQPISGVYRFRYLYEIKDHSLGEEVGINHFEEKSSFEMKLKSLRSSYRLIGFRTYDFWLQYFSPQAIQMKFLEYVDGSTASIGEDESSLDFLRLTYFPF